MEQNNDKNSMTGVEKRGTGGIARILLHGFGYGATAFVGLMVGGLMMLLIIAAVAGASPFSLFSGDLGSDVNNKVLINAKSISSDQVVAVVKKMGPSVVNIKTKTTINNAFHSNLQGEALGSGVIFREDGYILTNNHVVEGATEIVVTIGKEDLPAKLIGGDAETDIAVVKVDKKGLPAAELGSSKTLKVGEMAVAIGSPFGFQSTVTTGVVSGLNRTFQTDASSGQGPGQTYSNLIQTDAAINPGNSGGALADGKGRVIGINSVIYSQSGGSEGVGFAIPIETAQSVANQIINKGTVTHPYIGIVGQNVDSSIASTLGLPVNYGAVVQSVVPGSPADTAGLQKNDTIVKFDGQTIQSMEDLVSAIRSNDIGAKVTVSYYRDKTLKETTLTIADKPKS